MYKDLKDDVYEVKRHIDTTDASIITGEEVIDAKYNIESSMAYQVEKAEKQGIKKFYIAFHWQYDPVMSGMMGSWQEDKWVPADCGAFTSFGHIACPTPHYNQLVYKYDHGHIETMWFLPNHREFWSILKGELDAQPEVKFWVTSAYTGDLFKFIDKENGEDTVGKQVLVADPDTIN